MNERLLQPAIFEAGYHLEKFPMIDAFKELVRREDWSEVDREAAKLVVAGGVWFEWLQSFHSFSSIELMISVRDGANEWEEDGIWHDDGSRMFAFSLSLTLAPTQIEGGGLELRRKDDETKTARLATPDFGTAILFLTGSHGYEHRTRKVLKGRRIILVGWCT